jgi:hypothetical protein
MWELEINWTMELKLIKKFKYFNNFFKKNLIKILYLH